MKPINPFILTIYASLVICFLGCQSKNRTGEIEKQGTKTISDSLLISLNVNNGDSSKLGFEIMEGGPALGINSIFVSEKILFISDSYHNNIKKVQITENAYNLKALSNWFDDIMVGNMYYRNDTLFVLSKNTLQLKLLDSNLNLIGEKGSVKWENPEFVNYKNKVYISHSTATGIMLYDISTFQEYKHFKKDINGFVDGVQTYNELWFYPYNKETKILSNYYGKLKIPFELNPLYYCDGQNITFANNTLYFIEDFDVENTNKYLLKIYQFK